MMPVQFGGSSRSSAGRAFDADVLAWEAAVIANGGSVSLARRIIVDQFVYSEKANGTWAKTDDYWGLWGENAAQALTSLKQKRLATAVNSPTFTADRGYDGDGATSYINTGFVPSTHAAAMTTTTARLTAYERTNVSATTAAAGVESTNNLTIFPRTGGGVYSAKLYSTMIGSVAFRSDSRGYSSASLSTTAPSQNLYANGTLFEAVSSAMTASLPTGALYIHCRNAAGVANSFRASQIGFVAIGAQLSAAEELAHYNAVQAWATSIGANV